MLVPSARTRMTSESATDRRSSNAPGQKLNTYYIHDSMSCRHAMVQPMGQVSGTSCQRVEAPEGPEGGVVDEAANDRLTQRDRVPLEGLRQ